MRGFDELHEVTIAQRALPRVDCTRQPGRRPVALYPLRNLAQRDRNVIRLTDIKSAPDLPAGLGSEVSG